VATETDLIKVGIIGAGSVTERVHAPLVSNIPETRIEYIADVSDRCKRISNHFDTRAVIVDGPSDLPPCDAAVLAIPLGARDSYLTEFDQRGTPMFVEKPFAPSTDSHEAYLGADNQLFCDYMRTCFANTRQLRDAIQHGVFGDLRGINVIEEGKSGATGLSQGSYQTDPEMSGGGVLFERGCHTLSQLELVFQEWKPTIKDAAIDWNGDLDTEVNALIEFVKSDEYVPVSLRISRSRPIGNQTQCFFEHATVLFDQFDPSDPLRIVPHSKTEDLTMDPDSLSTIHPAPVPDRSLELSDQDRWAIDYNEAWYIRWKQFISIIQDQSDPDIGVETGPQTTRIITDIYDEAA
jgi:predicted dehydrogenase